jgi:hypothetical protein
MELVGPQMDELVLLFILTMDTQVRGVAKQVSEDTGQA